MEEQELNHYGVLGMKWGVRRNPSKTFSKSSKKANRLEKKVDKAEVKLAKYSKKLEKAQRRFAGWGFSSNDNLLRQTKRVARWTRKLDKRNQKVDKWMQNMRETFASTKISDISEKDIEVGRAYIDMLLDD